MSRARLALRPVLLLTLICALGFLPGIGSIPPLDRDESRFAQATKQMLETGDFVHIRFQDQPRNKKPAGIHWLQAASVALLSPSSRTEIWAYRVPTVLGAWIAVLATFALGWTLFDRRVGLIGAAMLGSAFLLVAESHLAKTDAVLLATVVLAQLALARAALAEAGEAAEAGEGPGWGNAILFWGALGVSAMIKGPIGPLVVLLTILAFGLSTRRWRWFRRLRPLAGAALALAIALPWYVAVSVGEGGFIQQAAGEDLLPKLVSGQESHGAWPGTYLLIATALFWPASLVAPAALAAAWRARAAPPVRFCLAWLVPGWVLFELVPTKLPHYVLPMLPALALLSAATVARALPRGEMLRHWAMRAYAVLWGLFTLALAGALFWAVATYSSASPAIAALPAVLVVATGAAALIFAWRERRGALPAAALLAGAAYVLIGQFVAPSLDLLWTSRTAHRLIAADTGEAPPVASVGFREPSLVFLLGTGTLLTGPGGAAAHLAREPGARALIERRFRDAFLGALAERGLKGVEMGAFEAFNYSRGRPIAMTLYRAEPDVRG